MKKPKYKVGDKVSVPVRFGETGTIKNAKDGVAFKKLLLILWYDEREINLQKGPGFSWSRPRTPRVTQIALFLLVCVLLSGCCSHREGDIVVKGGEAYVFERVLTREQIREGKEIEKLWLSYCKTNNNQPKGGL